MTLRSPQRGKRPERRARGRPPRAALDVLRVLVWYWNVRSRGPWTDYALNFRFVGKSIGATDGATSPKAFDRIRKFGTLPTDGSHHRRSFSLIDRVDADGVFRGTGALFRSPFWVLLAQPQLKGAALNTLIEELTVRLNLYRPTWTELPRSAVHWEGEPSADYQASIARLVTAEDLDSAALVGALYREAILEADMQLAAYLKGAFQDAMCKRMDIIDGYRRLPHLIKYQEVIHNVAFELCDKALHAVVFDGAPNTFGDIFKTIRTPFLSKEAV